MLKLSQCTLSHGPQDTVNSLGYFLNPSAVPNMCNLFLNSVVFSVFYAPICCIQLFLVRRLLCVDWQPRCWMSIYFCYKINSTCQVYKHMVYCCASLIDCGELDWMSYTCNKRITQNQYHIGMESFFSWGLTIYCPKCRDSM